MTNVSAPAEHSSGLRGVLPIVIAALLWGTTGTAAHFLPDDVSPLATGAATMAIGGVLLFAVSAGGALAALRDRRSIGWLLLGALGVFVYPLAFYSSMHLAGVAVGTVVSLGAAPVFAAVLEFLVDRRRVTLRWAVATTVAVVGVVLLATGGSAGTDAAASVWGVVLGIIAALSYALYTFASERAIGAGHSSRSVMGALFGVGAVLLAPVLLVTGGPLVQSGSSIAITGYLALGPMFVAYLLFGAGLRWVRSSSATVITLIEPAVATVLAVVIVGERFDLMGWLGLALVALGILLLVLPGRRPTALDAPRL
ncbi:MULTISPECIES: DMT family transporter [unclassified Leifsonia]|uniref:DMT family transporter n=1 Tax=unclassified Leifsonia TaxID=2663824 RepID=UPI000AE138AD|nr:MULTISPECIES: EamA family transporter [unclassified Leifsonia]